MRPIGLAIVLAVSLTFAPVAAATWGYNTPAAREAASRDGLVRPLELDQFRQGASNWL
jgi:hypothetical protein